MTAWRDGHPELEELSALHDDAVAPDERAGLEEHVEQCATCRHALAGLVAASRAVRALPRDRPSEALVARVAAAAAAEGRGPRRRAWWTFAAAAGVLLGALATWRIVSVQPMERSPHAMLESAPPRSDPARGAPSVRDAEVAKQEKDAAVRERMAAARSIAMQAEEEARSQDDRLMAEAKRANATSAGTTMAARQERAQSASELEDRDASAKAASAPASEPPAPAPAIIAAAPGVAAGQAPPPELSSAPAASPAADAREREAHEATASDMGAETDSRQRAGSRLGAAGPSSAGESARMADEGALARDAPSAAEQPIAVERASSPPVLVHRVLPQVPRSAHVSEGRVTLDVVVTERGAVRVERVVSATPGLEQPVVHAVSQWRYLPARSSGRDQAVRMTVTVTVPWVE